MTFYRKTELPNGLRIISEEIPHLRSVAVGVWVVSGSRYEAAEVAGVSHFLEHLLFKGTERRSAREIAQAMDAVGGQLNAFTGKEYTCFYAKVLDQHLPLALDLLADMLLCSRMDAADIQKEKGVIVEEIKLYEDTPDELVHDLFTQAVWERHPLGRAILGTAQTVEGLSGEAIGEYYRCRYAPGNMVVAAAGHLNHDRLVEEVARLFEGFRRPTVRPQVQPPRNQSGVLVRPKDTEQVHLCLGTPGVSHDDAARYPLHILNTILGGGSSSRFFQEIREERGLAYSVYSYETTYKDTGLFTVYAGMSPRYVREVVDIITRELEAVRREGIRPEELARAKEQLKGNLVLGLESSSSRMSRLGRQELCLRQVESPDEVIAAIDAVELDQVRELAASLLPPEELALAAIGPVPKELDLPGMLRPC